MTWFMRCQSCRKRGHTSQVDLRTHLLNAALSVSWRLCTGCFPAMVEKFNQAADAMSAAADKRTEIGA